MTESAVDDQALLRRTLVTAGAMVGACVLLVGTLTLVAVGIVNHAVSPASSADGVPASGIAPVSTAHVKPGVVMSSSGMTKSSK